MQRKGLLSLTYVSSDVDYKLVPNVPFRKSLLNMVSAVLMLVGVLLTSIFTVLGIIMRKAHAP